MDGMIKLETSVPDGHLKIKTQTDDHYQHYGTYEYKTRNKTRKYHG